MFKFVTIYRRVEEQDAQQTFFQQTHMPLAEQLPGVLKYEVSHVLGKPGGESRFNLMYELYFASRIDFENALLSDPGKALMVALKPWGDAKLVTWFYAEPQEETIAEAQQWAAEKEARTQQLTVEERAATVDHSPEEGAAGKKD